MDSFQILTWTIAGGFTIMFSLMIVMWNNINQRFEKIEKDTNQRFDKMDQRLDKIDEKITDIDRRLCRLEGAFASKDCCMIKDHRYKEKAD